MENLLQRLDEISKDIGVLVWCIEDGEMGGTVAEHVGIYCDLPAEIQQIFSELQTLHGSKETTKKA